MTESIPKPVVPILDIPLGAFALDRLLRSARPVVVNLSHLPDVARKTLSDVAAKLGSEGAVDFFVEVPEAYGAAGTLRSLIENLEETIVTCNADLLTDLEPSELMRAHTSFGADGTLAVREVSAGADLIVAGNRVDRVVDRRNEPRVRGMQFLGMAVLSKAALRAIPTSRPAGLTETLLGPMARSGRLAVHVHDGYAVDVGTPARYLAASLDVLHGRAPRLPIPLPGRIVELEGGPAYIGPGASVRQEGLGPDAVVLEGAVVREGARVERAIVWPGQTVAGDANAKNGIWAFGGLVATGDGLEGHA